MMGAMPIRRKNRAAESEEIMSKGEKEKGRKGLVNASPTD